MLYIITFKTSPKRKYPNGELIKIALPGMLTVEEAKNYIRYEFGEITEFALNASVGHIVISSARA